MLSYASHCWYPLGMLQFGGVGYGSASGSMTKKYEIVERSVRLSGGGFVKAIGIALIEMTCLGERRFDIAGYPYESENEALSDDWATIGADGRVAIAKVADEAGIPNGAIQGEKSGTDKETSSG